MTKAYDLIQQVPEWEIQDPSKVTCYLTCPRMYFYQYVLGWRPGEISNHLIFGSAWHKAMEILIVEGYETENIIKAHEALVKEYRKTFDPETDELYMPKTPETALIVLAKYVQRYRADHIRYTFDHVEIAGKVNISDDHTLHFRMDSIAHDKDGVHFSLEHKTGSSTYMWAEQWPLSMQVGCYSHVLYCMYPEEKVQGVVMNAAFFKKAKKGWEQALTGQRLTVQPPYDFLRYEATRSREQMQNWLWHAVHYMDMIKWNFDILDSCQDSDDVLMAFPMNPKNCAQYGRMCEYHDFCNMWPNPLRKCGGDPPMGFITEHWDPSAEEAKTNVIITSDETIIEKKGITNE